MLKTDPKRGSRMDPEAAETVAIQALSFVAGDPVQLNRFLQLTGLEAGEIREAARQPAFFAGLLDFVLAHEPTLVSFAQEAGLSPDSVVAARNALGGSYDAAPR